MSKIKSLLVIASITFLALSLFGCAPDSQTQEVIDKINTIGDVSIESEYVIEDARNSYDSLSEEQKNKVNNLSQLEEAERNFSIVSTIEAINNIESPITLESEKAISSANSLYKALNQEDQKSVTNYSVLEDAKQQLDNLKEQAKQFNVGETINTDSWNITLDYAKLTDRIDPVDPSGPLNTYLTPSSDSIFVSLLFTVENISNSSIKKPPFTNIKVYYGDKSYSNAQVQLNNGFWFDEFSDGFQPLRNENVYIYSELPLSATSDDLPIYIELMAGGQSKKITIR
jgi:hypothetical protein